MDLLVLVMFNRGLASPSLSTFSVLFLFPIFVVPVVLISFLSLGTTLGSGAVLLSDFAENLNGWAPWVDWLPKLRFILSTDVTAGANFSLDLTCLTMLVCSLVSCRDLSIS